jgi:YHS domain-containing protein
MGLRSRFLAGGLGAAAVVVAGLAAGAAAGDDEPAAPARAIPPALAPLEYLIGAWKGSGVPTANRVRGWPERHAWAWAFEKGVPAGLTVEMTGDRLLARARLAFDAASGRYVLSGIGLDGKPVTFAGTFDPKAKTTLVLDRAGATSDGSKQRLTLFPNSNLVRYSFWVSEQEPGAPQYKRTVEVGLTREGEAFAAGGAAADLPRCIVTGGAASLSVTYQGKTYPLCCSGCRDEFNDNPEKYIKKAALLAGPGAKSAARPGSSVNKDDGAFDGLVDEPPKAAKPDPAKAPAKPAAPAEATAKAAPAAGKGKDAAKAKAADPSARAAALLRLGQNLEKSGKADAALGYYRRVVKDFPDTPAAKAAAARVKALSPR